MLLFVIACKSHWGSSNVSLLMSGKHSSHVFSLFLAKCCTLLVKVGRKQSKQKDCIQKAIWNWVWSCVPPTPAFGRLKQEDREFIANLGYLVTLSLSTTKEGAQGILASTQ